jgi:phosphatidate cytidylyltransferase
MTNIQKRIFTSIIILPLSFFFILRGGYFLLFFLLSVFFIANYELFSVFNKKSTVLLLNLILILSLFSIYNLRDDPNSFNLLLWIIILVICSDVGGYFFGKIFKWKKITKISPKKTLSGVFGSFIFSLLSIFIAEIILPLPTSFFGSTIFLEINFLEPKFFFLAIIFSLVAQIGDLTISYFKRIEKVKDTGKILPGHGGILDRIDGLMFVAILVFILKQINIIP